MRPPIETIKSGTNDAHAADSSCNARRQRVFSRASRRRTARAAEAKASLQQLRLSLTQTRRRSPNGPQNPSRTSATCCPLICPAIAPRTASPNTTDWWTDSRRKSARALWRWHANESTSTRCRGTRSSRNRTCSFNVRVFHQIFTT